MLLNCPLFIHNMGGFTMFDSTYLKVLRLNRHFPYPNNQGADPGVDVRGAQSLMFLTREQKV